MTENTDCWVIGFKSIDDLFIPFVFENDKVITLFVEDTDEGCLASIRVLWKARNTIGALPQMIETGCIQMDNINALIDYIAEIEDSLLKGKITHIAQGLRVGSDALGWNALAKEEYLGDIGSINTSKAGHG